MFLWFENHSVFTLKPNVIASLNGSQSVSKRSGAMKNKESAENASGTAAPQNVLAL